MEAADLFLTLTTSLHITSLAAWILDTDALARPRHVEAVVEQTLGNERGLLTPCMISASAGAKIADQQSQRSSQLPNEVLK